MNTKHLKRRAFLVEPVSVMGNRTATAIVYCEANFGAIDGKTANGLVRHSERYEILSVIDSQKAGLDAGLVLDGEANGIPICRDLAESLDKAVAVPDFFVFGMAPSRSRSRRPRRRSFPPSPADGGLGRTST